ncbi:MAG: BON domain-containing protein [Acidobacteriota bacterium]
MRKTLLLLPVLTLLLLAAGCNRQPAPPSDQQLTSSVQSKLSGESALTGQNIQVAVNNGVVTLSGAAADPASRALAGNDAGSIPGVKTVVNNLTVLPPPQTASMTTPDVAPAPEPRRAPESHPAPAPRARHETRRPAHQQPTPAPPPPANNNALMPPPPPATTPTPAPAPAPPPQPVVKTVTLAAGTTIPVRLTDPLDSGTAQTDDAFHATLAADLVSGGMIVAPRGTPVMGRVVEAKDAAHFKGSSLLSLELTSLDLRNRHISISTDTYSQQGKARGKNTVEKAGGGALLGTLIGALAGGGKGAAIGAIAGAGAGTGINAATRGEQVKLPAETALNFTLQQPLSITTSRAVGSPAPANPEPDPTLNQRPH